jgi:uncharacterized phage protein (TIGR02220 family)
MKKISGGYVLKARKVWESEVAHAPPHVREIWDWLIMAANHTGKKKHGRILNRGQVLTSYDEIREALHWMVGWRKQRYTKSQCETSMKFLRKPSRNGPMITTTKTTRGIIITICNYDFYQSPKNYECRTESYIENHNETCSSPQTSDTIDKNVKNVKKERVSFPYQKIVSYLNQKTASNFKPTTPETKRLIKARFMAGFSEDDFYSVIDRKTKEWVDDEKMSQYLRPQTLFGTKFESYLNAKKKNTPHRPKNPTCKKCKISASNLKRGEPCVYCGGDVV